MNKDDISLMEREKISILIYTESFLSHPNALEYFKNVASFDVFEVNYLPVLDCKTKANVAQCKYKHIRERNIIHSVIELKSKQTKSLRSPRGK